MKALYIKPTKENEELVDPRDFYKLTKGKPGFYIMTIKKIILYLAG